jgi:hypothetical protein
VIVREHNGVVLLAEFEVKGSRHQTWEESVGDAPPQARGGARQGTTQSVCHSRSCGSRAYRIWNGSQWSSWIRT